MTDFYSFRGYTNSWLGTKVADYLNPESNVLFVVVVVYFY